MNDYRDAVDTIRYAVQSQECEKTPELEQAAAAYVRACHAVNERLQQVQSLLNKGLRTEASQMANSPPQLADVVVALDFPELSEWLEIVSLYDLPGPPPLSRDVLLALQDSFNAEHPLQHLLARHRRLALVRAPLTSRINVLRQIARVDPDIPHWKDDLKSYEKHRLELIREEIRQARQSQDHEALLALKQEIENGNWELQIPQKLRAEVHSSLDLITQQQADSELTSLMQELNTAFQELDLQRARQLRSHWSRAARTAQIGPEDPRQVEVSPILGWIEDEDRREAEQLRYESAIDSLEHHLNIESPLDVLDQSAMEVQRLGRELPDQLAVRYRNRKAALELAAMRGQRLKLGSILAGFLCVAGLVAFLVHRQLQSAEVARIVTAVDGLMEQRHFAEAEKLLAERNDIASWDSLVNVQTRLAQARADEQLRLSRWQAEIEQVVNASEYVQATAALERATDLALTDEEKLELHRHQRDWEARQRKAIADLEEHAQQQIRFVTQEIQELGRELPSGLSEEDEQDRRIAKLEEELKVLNVSAPQLRQDLASSVELLNKRFQKLADLRKQRLEINRSQARLTQRSWIPASTTDFPAAVSQVREAFIEYGELLGSDPRAERLKAIASEAPYWEAALAWNRLGPAWNPLWPTDEQALADRLALVQQHLVNASRGPQAELARRSRDQILSMQRQQGITQGSMLSPRQRLLNVFNVPLIGESWCLRTRAGTYYLAVDPGSAELSKEFFRVSQYFGYHKEDVREHGGVSRAELNAQEAVLSPSSRIARQFLPRLRQLNAQNWSSVILELAEEVRAASDMDPFLQLDLLRHILEAAGDCDLPLQEQLSQHLTVLKTHKINPLTRWMDPKDPDAERGRNQAEDVLKRFAGLSTFEQVWKQADQQRKQFSVDLQKRRQMIGWLDRDGSGWTVHTNWKPNSPTPLLVVFADAEKSISEWRVIGTADEDAIQVNANTQTYLSIGRPVFAEEPL